MKSAERVMIGAAAAIAIGMGVSACDKQHPAESVGQSIDQAAGNIADKSNKLTASIGAQSEKAGAAFDDAAITVRVKAAILAEPGLRVTRISVDTSKGIVTLNGSVDAPETRDKAQEIAANIAGVKEVDNRLLSKIGE
ncbi:MAG TPA: BON domain-containing protein [Burkholderiales bacterium]|jgi:osmotically-inducible protein OsmY|nr:BON domain-containing protein [Burkholderiales bacterium]